MAEHKVYVPELGDVEQAEIIEVLVRAGDRIEQDDPIITLESDKASMDVPSTAAGTVTGIEVQEGDSVAQGDPILTLEGAEEAEQANAPKESESEAAGSADQSETAATSGEGSGGETVEVKVPELGDFEDVEIIEVLVGNGDHVAEDDPLITLESDKATLEVPSTATGTVEKLAVGEGDKVSEGDVVLTLKTEAGAKAAASPPKQSSSESSPSGSQEKKPPEKSAGASPPSTSQATPPRPDASHLAVVDEQGFASAHASPSVRRYARQLGADLGRIGGSGRKERILAEDVERYVKGVVRAAQEGAAGGTGMPAMPEVDFSRFGAVEEKPLPRVRRLSAGNVHRNWLVVPHVTQFDEADVTDLEAFRKAENERGEVKLTPLAFIIKACALAIDRFPEFASSLDPGGEKLILKHYRHIGFAADTEHGLMVPVIRDVDRKSITDIARETGELAARARDGQIKSNEMQGSVFSVSSLGGIGGTAFTPIVNAPDVAILGVSRSQTRPLWDGEQFIPRTQLPLSLSYDHRVIDGAKAARFTSHLSRLLSDIRRLTL